jgi:hypothetical protein
MEPRRLIGICLLVLLAVIASVTAVAQAHKKHTQRISAPETTITSGPTGTISTSWASFSFTSTRGGTFECRLDGASWAGCSSPKSYPALANGSHLFEVRAKNRKGLVDSTPASRSFSVNVTPDTTPPDTSITSGPSGTTTTNSASFSLSSSESNSTYECRLNGAAWAGCASPKAYSNLANGSYTFDVRATDSAGNVDPSPASRSFAVSVKTETNPPDTTITSGPSGTINTNSISFGFSASETGSTFECRLNGSSWGGCPNPKSYSGLSNGSQVFDVRATDAAGNTDPSPAERSFTVSTTAQSNCTFGTFSATNMPGACWRPYADTSPFNRSVGTGSQVDPNSSAIVSRVVGFGGPDNISVGGAEDWSHPVYYSQPSDPMFTVHCVKPWGTCEVEGAQIRIPDAAQPASGGDGHMAVIDQANGWEYGFWQVQNKPAGGGTLSVSWGGKTRIGTADSDGLGSNATAAWFGLAAGVIRPVELEAGQVNHALFMTVKCTNGTSVWPAGTGAGSSYSSQGLSNANAPAMGQHFMLAMSDSEIDALSVPAWKKTTLNAMAHYGMFVGDTGGTGWGIAFESSASYTSFGQPDPWVRLGDLWGVPKYPDPDVGPVRVFKLSGAADWSRLRVVAPCVAQGTC